MGSWLTPFFISIFLHTHTHKFVQLFSIASSELTFSITHIKTLNWCIKTQYICSMNELGFLSQIENMGAKKICVVIFTNVLVKFQSIDIITSARSVKHDWRWWCLGIFYRWGRNLNLEISGMKNEMLFVVFTVVIFSLWGKPCYSIA